MTTTGITTTSDGENTIFHANGLTQSKSFKAFDNYFQGYIPSDQSSLYRLYAYKDNTFGVTNGIISHLVSADNVITGSQSSVGGFKTAMHSLTKNLLITTFNSAQAQLNGELNIPIACALKTVLSKQSFEPALDNYGSILYRYFFRCMSLMRLKIVFQNGLINEAGFYVEEGFSYPPGSVYSTRNDISKWSGFYPDNLLTVNQSGLSVSDSTAANYGVSGVIDSGFCLLDMVKFPFHNGGYETDPNWNWGVNKFQLSLKFKYGMLEDLYLSDIVYDSALTPPLPIDLPPQWENS